MVPSAEVLNGAVPQLLERHATRIGFAKRCDADAGGGLSGERLCAEKCKGNGKNIIPSLISPVYYKIIHQMLYCG